MTKKRLVNAPVNNYNRNQKKHTREGTMAQFAYMRSPSFEHKYEVGETVEVFCDHEKGSERVRGWLKGIVVQLDNKLVAVQFRTNIFLTDGWMVPDKILWYPVHSENIRPSGMKRKHSSKEITEY